ncbi:MAG: hypothetical protein WA840_05830 [Caulobacteraceae bacterium]
MRRYIVLGVLVAASVPVAAAAQAGFDGTWKADIASAQMPQKPDVYLLKGGVYQCKTCVPPVEVKADGADHPVTGHPYYDSVAIKVVGARTVLETDKKDGRVVTTSTTTLAPGGKTLTYVFKDSSNSKTPVTGKVVETKVAAGPAGSHALSGSWRTTKVEGVSDNGLTVSFKVEGDTLHMSAPTGQSYAARIDGAEAPFMGDPGVTSVQVRKLDDRTLEETDKRDGKVVAVMKMTVAPGGKTILVAVDNKLQGSTMSYTAVRQ